MKRIIALLSLLFLLVSFTGCVNNGTDETYDNSDPNNLEEDLYEDEMGDPALFESFLQNDIYYYFNL